MGRAKKKVVVASPMENRVLMPKPAVALRRLELNGQTTVLVNEPNKEENAGRGKGKETGKQKNSNAGRKLMSVWLLPDGSISFRKPRNLAETNRSSIMLRSRTRTTWVKPSAPMIKEEAAESKFQPTCLWQPYVVGSGQTSSRRKKTIPIRLDQLIAQATDIFVPDDQTALKYLKKRYPAVIQPIKTGKLPSVKPSSKRTKKNNWVPNWKVPKIFFKGTLFESLLSPTVPEEPAVKPEDVGSNPPQWVSPREMKSLTSYEVLALRIRDNSEDCYIVGKDFDLSLEVGKESESDSEDSDMSDEPPICDIIDRGSRSMYTSPASAFEDDEFCDSDASTYESPPGSPPAMDVIADFFK